MESTRNEILEHDFGGDLEAYADANTMRKPKGVEDDLNHPWHQRRMLTKLFAEMPDDCISPPQIDELYTRAEICEIMDISDSTLGKWKIKPRCRSGSYSCYALRDVVDFRVALSYREGYRQARRENPKESLAAIASRLAHERANEFGPVKYWYPEADLSKIMEPPFVEGQSSQ